MKETLIIVGASGHGKVVADIALKMNQWKNIFFLDDNKGVKECLGFKVIGTVADSIRYKEYANFFVAIGNNNVRKNILKSFIEKGFSLVNLIHPSVILGKDVYIGMGSVLMAGVIINSSTVIGKGCIINTGSIIDHDNLIEEYVHISPGVKISGTVKIGKKCWIGVGTIICNNITICKNCLLGAGTVVINDIKEAGTYVGIPSRKID